MKTRLRRAFSGKAIDFLIVAETMHDAFVDNQSDLVAKNTKYTPLYLDDFKTEIRNGFNIIGGDKARAQRLATRFLNEISGKANTELAIIKKNLLDIYYESPADLTENLRTLGFTEHLEKARGGEHSSLIELLKAFDTNLTPSLEAELLAGGVAPTSISIIRGFATSLLNANISQITLMGEKKDLTEADTKTLNAIHHKLMAIANLGKIIFKDNRVTQEKFVYRIVHNRVNVVRNNDDSTPATPAPTTPPAVPPTTV